MTYFDFQTTTCGKWILVGEHAVVRGHDALVFPIKEKLFQLRYSRQSEPLGADYSGVHGPEMRLLFWSVLEEGMNLLGYSLNQLNGHFYIDNTIPVGTGMGASAALCVAMSRWFSAQDWIKNSDVNQFAQKLENLFHGKSSGLDIIGVSSEHGMYFKQGHASPINQKWQPNWYLSSCNQIGITAHCIQIVQNLWDKDPKKAKKIDEQMLDAVMQAKRALESVDVSNYSILKDAINLAADCFLQWGLVSESLQSHMNHLMEEGAVAVKPTGSGGGGYVLSLWDRTPPNHMGLISV